MNKRNDAMNYFYRSNSVVPNLIYHYCDSNAFLSIIQNKKIWVSSSDKMNDEDEFQFFINNLRKLAVDTCNEALISILENKKIAASFLCCFSEKEDLLSQWRAYGEDGHGFAIGFNPEKLKTHNTQFFDGASHYFSSDFMIQPVNYNQNHSKEFFNQFLEFQKNEKLSSDNIVRISRLIDYYSCLEKNKYFEEEKEVRLAYIPLKSIVSGSPREIVIDDLQSQFNMSRTKFRNSKGNIIPYFEYDLVLPESSRIINETAIEHIVLGPKNNMSINEIEDLIEHSYIKKEEKYKVSVTRSEGTYC